MLKINKIIIFLLLSFSSLYAQSGINQENLLSVESSVNSSDVSYKVKPIEVQKSEQVEIIPTTIWQKFIAYICSFFCDNLVECPLYQYFYLHNTYETIEGHLLPHEPDNPDDTLLGVDKNTNGVRDDVERWIYKDMPTYHHPETERVIAMTKAKAYQMVLLDPTNQNNKVFKAIDRASDCWAYYSYSKLIPFDDAVVKFGNRLRDKQFNTRKRLKTYLDYDYTLRGTVSTATALRLLNTSYCDKNIDVLP